MEMVQSMINPFTTTNDKLVSLSSGAVAATEVQEDLLRAELVGEQQLSEYMTDRLVKQKTDVFSAIKLSKLKTFSTQTKTQKSATVKSLKADRSIFTRLLVVSKQREIDLQRILTYSISPVSPSLSSSDGEALSKTNKAALLHHIELVCASNCSAKHTELSSCSLVVDAMALIQSFPCSKLPSTFGEFADAILKRLLSMSVLFKATRVDFVGDRYMETSIKNIERNRRVASSQDISIYGKDQKLPQQWKKFLGSGQNKEKLQEFLCKQWKHCTSDISVDLFTGIGEEAMRYSMAPGHSTTTTVIEELAADHEEADTRLILHANHCGTTHDSVVIWSPDTDVAIIAVSHFDAMLVKNLYFATGTGKNQRLLNLTNISTTLGTKLASNLIALHAFSGCDSTSSFYGKGKKKAYTTLTNQPSASTALAKVGTSYELDMSIMPAIENFVCAMYGTSATTVGEARFNLFCSSGSIEQGSASKH